MISMDVWKIVFYWRWWLFRSFPLHHEGNYDAEADNDDNGDADHGWNVNMEYDIKSAYVSLHFCFERVVTVHESHIFHQSLVLHLQPDKVPLKIRPNPKKKPYKFPTVIRIQPCQLLLWFTWVFFDFPSMAMAICWHFVRSSLGRVPSEWQPSRQ